MKHTSTILTCLGAAGVVATAVMAVKATPKALRLLQEAQEEKGEELTKLETVKTAAPAYIPAAGVCVATLGCIFGANVVNKRTQASLMSAYALLDQMHKEYKNKVKEINEEVDIQAKAEIVGNHFDKNVEVEPGNKLFCDFHSLQYFESTDELVEKAEQEINRRLKKRGYVLLNEYYELLGMPITTDNDMRWSIADGYSEVGFGHDIATINDDFDCCVIFFDNEPSLEFPF
jgi:hypothetical protein